MAIGVRGGCESDLERELTRLFPARRPEPFIARPTFQKLAVSKNLNLSKLCDPSEQWNEMFVASFKKRTCVAAFPPKAQLLGIDGGDLKVNGASYCTARGDEPLD